MSVQQQPLPAGRRLPRPRSWAALGAGQREGVRLGLLVLALAAIGALVYGPHAVNGGFLGDSWTLRQWYQLYPHADFFGTVGHFLDLNTMQTRPLNAVYRTILNYSFGGDMGSWFVWQIAANVLMSSLLYLLLRRLSLSPLDSALIAVLVLLFPAASSLRFWMAVSHAPVAISFAIAGFLFAFAAFDAVGRKSKLLHALSLLLFVSSLLLYEVALPVMLASVLLYRFRVPWRAAARRWGLDLLVLLPIALLVTRSEDAHSQAQSDSGALAHLWKIVERAPRLLGDRLLPLSGAEWVAVLAIAALAGGGIWALRSGSWPEESRPALRRYLFLIAAGLVVIALGYSIYVPGINYYEPTMEGIADRINAVPGFGWVFVLYGSIGILATLVLGRRWRNLVPLGATVLSAILVALWLPLIATESRNYVKGFEEGQRVLGLVRSAVPDPPPHTTIWTFGQPVEVANGVPIFGNTWDMTYSVQLMYGDRTIRSYVGFPGTYIECLATKLVPGGNASYPTASPPGSSAYASDYGTVYFVNTVTGQFERIDSRGQCLQALRSYRNSPAFPTS
jgi:hypothetical protein